MKGWEGYSVDRKEIEEIEMKKIVAFFVAGLVVIAWLLAPFINAEARRGDGHRGHSFSGGHHRSFGHHGFRKGFHGRHHGFGHHKFHQRFRERHHKFHHKFHERHHKFDRRFDRHRILMNRF